MQLPLFQIKLNIFLFLHSLNQFASTFHFRSSSFYVNTVFRMNAEYDATLKLIKGLTHSNLQ